MKWRWWYLFPIAVAGLLWAFYPRSFEVEIGRVLRGELVQTLSVEGRLQSHNHLIVTAMADGELRRMPLEVGDLISKGEVITELYWDLQDVPVRAPMTGVISKVHRESPGPIRRGEPILELVDPSHLEVVVELLTPEAMLIHEGDPAKIRGWGEELVLPARVSRVSRAGFTKPSALGVEEERTEVRLQPAAPWPEAVQSRLGSHFHVEVEIETERRQDVLQIPVGALFREGEQWASYVLRLGKAELQNLEIGVRSEESVEVLRGLGEGDRVVVYPGEFVKPGLRIKEKRQ